MVLLGLRTCKQMMGLLRRYRKIPPVLCCFQSTQVPLFPDRGGENKSTFQQNSSSRERKMSFQGLWSQADILQLNKSGPARRRHRDTCSSLPRSRVWDAIIPQKKMKKPFQNWKQISQIPMRSPNTTEIDFPFRGTPNFLSDFRSIYGWKHFISQSLY